MTSSFWSPVVGTLKPYVPGEQPRVPDLVKLNTNENPYPPSPAVLAALDAAVRSGLERYPDPESTALRRTIAGHHGLQLGEVFVGNGSDEVLAHAFQAFFQHADQPLLMPDITYSFYAVYCGLYGIQALTVPLREGLRLQVADLQAPAGQRVAGVVVANPNAPTGIGLPLRDIEQLLRQHPERVVLVDEAYVDFGGQSAVPLIEQYPNLLVVHTLSKSRSLAGLRVGVAMGQRHLIDALERIKNSFNSYPLDKLAQAGAQAAYEDRAYFDRCRQAVMDSREGLSLQLEDLGFEVLPSQTNFIFVRHPQRDAGGLAAGLRERAVLVRHFRLPRIEQYLRISVGTPDQCQALVDALRALLAQPA
ncbi:histidinol-phosphate transaminase [Curvibacter sp. HBC61]|uniref:Histidinol-phosphate aminotransferase n=1 Tax=Curvibacter cyanobacteriorum TaxID=3026422 RepID=A0ABT5N043_9BURK|nr:histidinol-phosphate transaminase [Curvibacter sp. HBC61]MDD0838388.1 histidinol-phosphate transaminase [Curvibacter sp. HBC61]